MRRLLAAIRDWLRAGYALAADWPRSSAGAALALVCALSLGCWLTKPPPVNPTPPDGGFADASAATVAKDCTETALHNAWVKLIPSIETAMATGSIQAAVATEAAIVGIPLATAEFICGVQYLVSVAEGRFAETNDRLERTKATNGKAWLASQGVAP